MHNKEAICEIKLAVPGRHNAGNAMAAIALACTMGISTDAIIRGLDAFHGANRRFQYKGTVDGVTIIDDYAHHLPWKVLRQNHPEKLWCESRCVAGIPAPDAYADISARRSV